MMPSPVKRSSVPSCSSTSAPIAAWYSPSTRHHVLGLGVLGERREAAQVEEDDRDLAPMALERVLGAAGDDQLGELRREEALQPADLLELADAVRDALLERAVQLGELALLAHQLVVERLDAQQRAHPREQLVLAHRLAEEVVGAGVQALGALLGRVERRHQDDRQHRVRRVGADRAADVVAAHSRHHHVEQDEIGRLGGDRRQRLGAGGRGGRAVALHRQQVGEQLDVQRNVVDDEHAGGRTRPPLGEKALHGVEEGLQVDRLGDEGIETGTDDLLLVVGHDRRRNGDHRHAVERRVLAYPAQRLDAVDVGELDVHQDQVGRRSRAPAAPRPGR